MFVQSKIFYLSLLSLIFKIKQASSIIIRLRQKLNKIEFLRIMQCFNFWKILNSYNAHSKLLPDCMYPPKGEAPLKLPPFMSTIPTRNLVATGSALS